MNSEEAGTAGGGRGCARVCVRVFGWVRGAGALLMILGRARVEDGVTQSCRARAPFASFGVFCEASVRGACGAGGGDVRVRVCINRCSPGPRAPPGSLFLMLLWKRTRPVTLT